MARVDYIEVSRLSLDLKNFRTTPQTSEENAVRAMISIHPDRFYAILESIIEDGYMPTENIIVLRNGPILTVMEGNRRIAALKLILGLIPLSALDVPKNIVKKIDEVSLAWKSDNSTVPCNVYELSEASQVDKIVNRTHGKGEKASRAPWPSVATARHNRDVNRRSELGLDLLEKYLKYGNNISSEQSARWSGDYGVTILDEALAKLYSRLGFKSIAALVDEYPSDKKLKEILDKMMLEIGLKKLSFKKIRDANKDFAINYGVSPIPSTVPDSTGTTSESSSGTGTGRATESGSPGTANPSSSNTSTGSPSTPPPVTNPTGTSSSSGASPATPSTSSSNPVANAINDPRNVAEMLNRFTPRGNNRQKVVTLRNEMKTLDIKKNPIAFCFLLRSMFEISAKAYCKDHSIQTKKAGGEDKKIAALLLEISKHMVDQTPAPDKRAKEQELHGATAEITKPTGLLSVTSMNQLIHSTTFSISPPDISTLFYVIYPLLEAMNN